ncbi:MAG: type II toxin-antitoxin system RelE/ParE family toxin [Deltaproteobacteria bacterium]|nr:type II toxin-antitoxin system RelE/ParE family toxin [Deltaproteobacteria bacterium]
MTVALRLITDHPSIGQRAQPHLRGVRRVLLPRAGYFVYYRVDEARRRIEVLAIWHTSRGPGPFARRPMR